MRFYSIKADTQNPNLVGHAINISGIFEDELYYSVEGAKKRIPSAIRYLREIHEYSQEILDEIELKTQEVEVSEAMICFGGNNSHGPMFLQVTYSATETEE